ncbi:MAG TPA: leucine-rich repeat domain-containing protein [Pyrinomonadaceae bacterium]|nr:leucine-rich repeat domain-containing protein [Pyrinomonadaceae bacterium]
MAKNKAYRKAEKKIEAARRSGAKELDLSAEWKAEEKLTQLPESIGQLAQLHSLKLFRNQLTTLPESLGQLTQLQSLYLSHNELTSLPESLGQLTQLHALDLTENQLTELPRMLSSLTELHQLLLGRNRLSALPESLGQLTQLHTLSLDDNQLRVLPESLRHLTQLAWLDLDNNQLTALPEWLGELTQLETLYLANNRLTALPESMSQLTGLELLDLSKNQLSGLPEWLGQLTQLQTLSISYNPVTALTGSLVQLTQLQSLSLDSIQMTTLPEWLGEITQLEWLDLDNNQLTALPETLGQLTKLDHLYLSNNQLATLPDWLARLELLVVLKVDGNPLNPELAAAYNEGLDAVKRYLRELAKGTKKRYEAKLLILGDGNEGKSCVSRALRGLPFQHQVTTRGVDVEQWKFGHPDEPDDASKVITLNIWDFEGQEINHQTHQFFLTTQALYLIVFKCRDQFLMDRAEYWLDTIKARAPSAKVAIVITQCEERTPYVPQDKLQSQYGELFVEGQWLFPVGCGDNSGVAELQSCLKRWAADLDFMGSDWPQSYSRAEGGIKERAGAEAHITRTELNGIFEECEIDQSVFKDLARSMSILGAITQFPDCPDLTDFVVLQPQWLTKAISEIMEDKQLTIDKGEILLQRMETVWDGKGYGGLFATFHNCMKEFELCYDLEDRDRSCLVPLRFGYEKPPIPWTINNGVKERRVEYKLNIRPPTGIMSRFIVKTHHMIVKTAEHPKGIYWHNGVFLRTGEGKLTSEALCEFDSDQRKLRIEVRAAFPQNLLEQIHGYVRAVFSFFGGLEPERSYGCIKFEDDTPEEIDCVGLHTEKRIFSEILNQSPTLNCEHGFHKVDPRKLIFGFSSFGEFVPDSPALAALLRRELDKKPVWAETLTQDLGKLLVWVDDSSDKLDQLVRDQANLIPEIKQQVELKLHDYLGFVSDMLDDRNFTSAPGIISISTRDQSRWNPASYFKKTYLLTPFCESLDNIHPCEDGQVEFMKDREWWEKTAPWIARGTKVLAAGLQLAFAGMPLALEPQTFDAIKDHVKLMNELTKHMELKADTDRTAGAVEVFQRDSANLSERHLKTRLMRTALARFLEETAPNNYRARRWGSLERVHMSDNSYRWLCETHARSRP